MRREASPADRAGQAKLIEIFGIIAGDTAREDLAFPGICRRFKTLQLTQSFEQAALAQQLGAWRDVLPAEQPVHELRRSHGLNLLAELREGKAMEASQEATLAPCRFVAGRISEFSAQDNAAGLEAKQRFVHVGYWYSEGTSELDCGDWAAVRHPAGDHGKLRVSLRCYGGRQLWERSAEDGGRENLVEGVGAFRGDPESCAVALCAGGATVHH